MLGAGHGTNWALLVALIGTFGAVLVSAMSLLARLGARRREHRQRQRAHDDVYGVAPDPERGVNGRPGVAERVAVVETGLRYLENEVEDLRDDMTEARRWQQEHRPDSRGLS